METLAMLARMPYKDDQTTCNRVLFSWSGWSVKSNLLWIAYESCDSVMLINMSWFYGNYYGQFRNEHAMPMNEEPLD